MNQQQLQHQIFVNENKLKTMLPALTYADKEKFKKINDETKSLIKELNQIKKERLTF